MSTDFSIAPERNYHHSLKQLRERAEKRRVQSLPGIIPNAPEQTQRLVQELQIHQIELEMQYEELQQSLTETEELRARYLDLFDFAPVGYLTIDVLGIVQELNLHGAKLLGAGRGHLTNRRFLQFVALSSRDAFLRMMIDVLASKDPVTLDVDLLTATDEELRVRLDGISLPDPNGTRLCRLALTDLTTEFHATAARDAIEARFETLLVNSPDPMLLLRLDYVVAANPAAVGLFGVATPRDLIGRTFASLAPPTQPNGHASLAAADQLFVSAQRAGHVRTEWTGRRLDNGEDVRRELTFTPLTTDGPALVLATWR